MKRIFPLLLIFLILSSLVPQKSQAAAPLVARVVAGSVGERVIVAIAEKSGVKFASKTAREKAVERWNLELYEKIKYYDEVGEQLKADELKRFQNSLANLNETHISTIPNKTNFGQILVDSAMFLTGADIIYDIYDSIKSAYDHQEYMDRMKDVARSIALGDIMTSYRGVSVFKREDIKTPIIALGLPWDINNSLGVTNYNSKVDWSKKYWLEIRNANSYVDSMGEYIKATFITYFYVDGITEPQTRTYPQYPIRLTENVYTEPFTRIANIPDINFIPTITPLPWVQPHRDNGTVPSGVPSVIPVDIPLTRDYPEEVTTPWNKPISDFTSPDLEPVADSDPTPDVTPVPGVEQPPIEPPPGGEPPKEEKPPIDPPTGNFLPIALLLALLDLLASIIAYLLRMMEFILTIPLIPSKPVGNPAFEWFKSAKIVGIQIYPIVSGLATIGLSFLVFKSIRKVLP